MTITLDHQDGTNILEVGLSGKLTSDDYASLLAQVQRMFKTLRTLRLLVSLGRFAGWTAGTLWDDIESSLRQLGDVERLAIVGSEKWRKGADVFCAPFANAQFRYFSEAQLQLALTWLKE